MKNALQGRSKIVRFSRLKLFAFFLMTIGAFRRHFSYEVSKTFSYWRIFGFIFRMENQIQFSVQQEFLGSVQKLRDDP